MSKVYSVRLADRLAYKLDAYLNERRTSTQTALQEAIILLLETRPALIEHPQTCAVCTRPLGSHVIMKSKLAFDTLDCFNTYLHDAALSAARSFGYKIPELVTPLKISWGDIFEITQISELGRQHYVITDDGTVCNPVVFTSETQMPTRCATCYQQFRLSDLQKDVLVVASDGKNYHHLDCCLPASVMLQSFQLAVLQAVGKLSKALMIAFEDNARLPMLTIDPNDITIERLF